MFVLYLFVVVDLMFYLFIGGGIVFRVLELGGVEKLEIV